MTRVKDSAGILLTSLIDYAGLFPPAALDMKSVVANWQRYTQGPQAWMLGRLVVPISKLDELHHCLQDAQLPGPGQDPWRLTALVGENLDADIDRIFEFNRQHASVPEGPEPKPGDEHDAPDDDDESSNVNDLSDVMGGVFIDAIELKAPTAASVDAAMKVIPEQIEPFFEVNATGPNDIRGIIAAMAGTGARAKIRTGGITHDAFPSARSVARFLAACSAADVPFKATAGLHHAVRGEFPLTYEPECPRGTMFGFLNVFVAAAFIRSGRFNEADAVQLLEEVNPKTFVFDNAGLTWRDRRLDAARLARARETFATSFGSCSFEEPLADLRTLGILDA